MRGNGSFSPPRTVLLKRGEEMKRSVFLFVFILLAASAQAQERKIEIAPFAGGYFSAGFQSVKLVGFGPAATVRDLKPVDEPNSGIFGVRASFDLTRRFTLEGTFGFSPAGREFVASFGPLPLALGGIAGGTSPAQPGVSPSPPVASPSPPTSPTGTQIAIPVVAPLIRGNDTFHYSGNVLFRWPRANGWTPFITGGLGAVTRTAEGNAQVRGGMFGLVPGVSPSIPIRLSFVVPSPTETDFSVNFGGGVKKYFTSRCGIRFDFRDYVSTLGEDTVNNLEVSFGLILRL